jgi:uncharacterized membrane protein YdjX (TVP38/TMEM64 family)
MSKRTAPPAWALPAVGSAVLLVLVGALLGAIAVGEPIVFVSAYSAAFTAFWLGRFVGQRDRK